MQALEHEEVVAAFQRKDDLYIPDLESIRWADLDYLGWVHPSGHLGFVVLQSPNSGDLRGVRMRRSLRTARRPRLEMCSWCHHVHKARGTAIFTVSVRGSEGRHTMGNAVCRDLDCSLRIRNLKDSVSFMSESMYEPAKVWRMQQSMHRWLGRAKQL
jgi:hypothetical protein